MTYNSESQVYYYKFLELQEKLRKSEEDRLKLEIKLNEMIQSNREEEHQYYKTLKSQYKDFIKYDTHRMLRNEQILQALEKIEMKISLLSSKTERFKLLRQHYQAYLDRTNPPLRGKSNLPNVSNPPEQKNVTENLNSLSMPLAEQRRKDESYNHNYVYNYLKKNLQNTNILPTSTDSMLNCPGKLMNFNESLPPLYSFSQTKVETPKNISNNNEDHQENQHVDVTQKILFQNDHYKEKYSPQTSHDQPQGYVRGGLYNNPPITSLEIQGKQSSTISFPGDCGNTFDNKLFSSDHLKIITPDIHIRNKDSLPNSLYPNTHETQIKPIQIETNNHDCIHKPLLNQISSYKQSELCEYNNQIISNNKPVPDIEVNDNVCLDTVAKEIGDFKYIKDEEEKGRLQLLELSTEPSSSKVQLDHNEMVQKVQTDNRSKSIENQIHELNQDFNSQNSLDQMILPDQKTSDYQIEENLEQKIIIENEIPFEIASNVTKDVENINQEISTEEYASHDGKISIEEYVSETIQPVVENADGKNSDVKTLTTAEETIYKNDSEALKKNEFENVPNHTHETSQMIKPDAAEVPTDLEEPEENVTVQTSEYQLENQEYYGETQDVLETNRTYESTDQFQVYDENSEQDSSGNQYPQYLSDEQLLNDGQTELTQYETENVQKMPTGFEKQTHDETVLAVQSNIHYDEEQVNNSEEIGNIGHSNQNFDPNNDFQTYADNSEQYLPSDQYPQYGQNEEGFNYDQNITQNFSENQQPYNMQYDEKDVAYMTYDENNQGYNQQYYEHDANYANYENGGQEYDQNQYDLYNQESYPPEQHTVYEGQDHEPLDTNLAASGANYHEAEYNTDGLCQNFVKQELEPVSQSENNVTGNVTNLMNILETDSENVTDKSDVKVSNESDFDFSVTQ
ncbi:hypothetical protein WA026_011840 [Henosepilachna vigintioctopunctata]|uniref:Uncharacterized protein n=1 Tax=Henosepilachna vigintioctopunctata TaxID=420089 RepID=A0AAW1UAD3_9CUCU